jgi:thiamine-phosphate pyrophosphorylase
MERSVYRIIDANFNRAREAVRVVEEFCRFALNCEALTARAKQLRHRLCGCLSRLDAGRLIASRDSLADVGVGKTVDGQLSRASLRDCFTAACKRLTESLRALSEMSQTLNPDLAEQIEELRFAAYTLEKDIVVFADTTQKFKRVSLYVIISSSLPADVLSLANRCAAGGADCIQMRAKNIADDELFALAVEFADICRNGGVLSILNDRADIAVAAGADGVHLGQNDLPVEQTRRLQLTPLIIGKSTHSVAQLQVASGEQPTYVSLGPVFSTPTKPDLTPVGLEYVTGAAEALAGTGIGHVAIGGITPDNVEKVLKAGAKTIAVCSAVTEAADPAAVCRMLKEKITAYTKKVGQIGG